MNTDPEAGEQRAFKPVSTLSETSTVKATVALLRPALVLLLTSGQVRTGGVVSATKPQTVAKDEHWEPSINLQDVLTNDIDIEVAFTGQPTAVGGVASNQSVAEWEVMWG